MHDTCTPTRTYLHICTPTGTCTHVHTYVLHIYVATRTKTAVSKFTRYPRIS